MISFTKFYLEHQLEDYDPAKLPAWLTLISGAYSSGAIIPGYRDGVILVKFQSSLRHSTITLSPDEPVLAAFSGRVSKETPRKRIYVERTRDSLPYARSTFAVLYRKDVLAEDGDFIDTEWGVVAHLTSSLDIPEPMHPDTLIANHFRFDGGTSTQMNPEVFMETLRESVSFWKDKVTASIPKIGIQT